MPALLYVVVALYSIALLVVFCAGFELLVLRRPFPGYTLLVGQYRPFPIFWQIFSLSGWLAALGLGVVNLFAATRPLTRREEIHFNARSLELRESTFHGASVRTFDYVDIGAFRLRTDIQGLRESEIIVLLNRPLLPNGEDELTVCQSTTEAEKRWLTSVFNVFLARHKI